MKFEKGMYVRTNKGIAQIVMYDRLVYLVKTDIYDYVPKSRIIGEPSFELIDLIQAGDYVNGYKVDFVQNGYVVFNNNHPRQLLIYPKDIETIVTKEQFESMRYKVEE